MIRLSRFFILFGQVMFLGIVTIFFKYLTCPFKLLFKIPCPFCGLTRALKALLYGNVLKALYYNILLIPFIGVFLFLNVVLILEIIRNDNIIMNQIKKYFNRYRYKIVWIGIILSIFSILINLYHRI